MNVKNNNKDIREETKKYFEHKFNRSLNDTEMSEIMSSMFYLGSAIYKFQTQKAENVIRKNRKTTHE